MVGAADGDVAAVVGRLGSGQRVEHLLPDAPLVGPQLPALLEQLDVLLRVDQQVVFQRDGDEAVVLVLQQLEQQGARLLVGPLEVEEALRENEDGAFAVLEAVQETLAEEGTRFHVLVEQGDPVGRVVPYEPGYEFALHPGRVQIVVPYTDVVLGGDVIHEPPPLPLVSKVQFDPVSVSVEQNPRGQEHDQNQTHNNDDDVVTDGAPPAGHRGRLGVTQALIGHQVPVVVVHPHLVHTGRHAVRGPTYEVVLIVMDPFFYLLHLAPTDKWVVVQRNVPCRSNVDHLIWNVLNFVPV